MAKPVLALSMDLDFREIREGVLAMLAAWALGA